MVGVVFADERAIGFVQPLDAREAVRVLAERGVLGGVSLGRLYPDEAALANGLVVAVTETCTAEDIERFATTLEAVLQGEAA